jgi:hypothetical protein
MLWKRQWQEAGDVSSQQSLNTKAGGRRRSLLRRLRWQHPQFSRRGAALRAPAGCQPGQVTPAPSGRLALMPGMIPLPFSSSTKGLPSLEFWKRVSSKTICRRGGGVGGGVGGGMGAEEAGERQTVGYPIVFVQRSGQGRCQWQALGAGQRCLVGCPSHAHRWCTLTTPLM